MNNIYPGPILGALRSSRGSYDPSYDPRFSAVSYPGLRAGEREKVNFAKVVSGDEQSLCIWTAHSIDVSPIWAIRPQT